MLGTIIVVAAYGSMAHYIDVLENGVTVRQVPENHVIGYFRTEDGRILAPREIEDFNRLAERDDLTYLGATK